MSEITYTLIMEQENPCKIAGNFDDPRDVEMVRKRRRDGNEYAWFGVRVVATCQDFQEESNWLGCCSYENEEDFKASDPYEDMRDVARDRLLATLRNAAELHRQTRQAAELYRELTAQD